MTVRHRASAASAATSTQVAAGSVEASRDDAGRELRGLLAQHQAAAQSWKDAALRVASEVGEKAATALKAQRAETAAVQLRLDEAIHALGRMRAQSDIVRREAAEAVGRHAAVAAQLDAARKRIEVLEAEAAEAAEVLAAAKFKRNLQIKALERNVAELQAAVADVERRAAAQEALIAAARHEREAVLGSFSWRMTQPLRWLAGQVRPPHHPKAP